jgi:thioesterase domain-containing protein/NAD(P)-dependent dehydrogenase (short-subunit alcohol dehydrogenase family)/acyl carrier protein
MNQSIKADKVLSSLRHPEQEMADDIYFLTILGQLWTFGVPVDFDQFWGEIPRQKVVLPSYAFQRSRYLIDVGQGQTDPADAPLMRQKNPEDWTYAPVWMPQLAACEIEVDTDLESAEPQVWLIFLDQGGTGAALAERLRSAGQTVATVSTGDAFATLGPDSYALAPEQGRAGYDSLIQSLIATERAPDRIVHLWLLTEEETHRPGSSFFHRNQEQGLMSLFYLAQAVSEENLPTPLHINTISNGAAQVRREALPYPEKATVLGAVQVMGRELPGVSASLLDVETPTKKTRSTLISRLLEEVLAPPKAQIAAWRGEKRFERHYRNTAFEPGELPVWKNGGTYLITGGFGGIGLTLAERMITEAGANVVLLARDGLPARDSWPQYLQTHAPQDRLARRIEAVMRLETLGGAVMPLAADVCNIDEMAEAVAAAKAAFGPIHGVIHGAGVIDDGPLLAKTSAGMDDVLAPKLHGTEVLEQLFPDGDLDWLVLFASSSTATAPAGQIDYVAANAYLNAYAQSRQGGQTRVRAINWGLWAEVGMAAEAVAARQGDHSAPPVAPIDTPLLTGAGFDAAGHRIFTTTLRASDWILDEHRTRANDAAVMPGTGYVALAYEALAAQGETADFALQDLLFLRPLHVADGESCDLRVVLQRSAAGYDVSIQSAVMVDGQTGWQTHAEAQIAPVGAHPEGALDLAMLKAACTDVQSNGHGTVLSAPQEAHMRFGPRWQVLREMAMGAEQGLATLRLEAQFAQDGLQMPPGLLDIATGWAMDLIPGYAQGHLWVPVGYARLARFAPLPEEVISHARLVSGSSADGTARFDITLTDAEGQICAEVTGLALRQVETAAGFANAAPLSARDVQFEALAGAQAPLSAAEERLAHNLSQGIPPALGAQMFEGALRDGRAQLVISSLDLEALMAQAAAATAPESTPEQGFERPELESDFVAPRTEIERTLSGFWQTLLGVEQVGVQDSFFDLGGHSLIAVRLFAMVKKTWGIEFPISVLFEATTIESCAALIAAQVGEEALSGDAQTVADEGPVGSETDAPPAPRFTHLVPMHAGDGGTKTPFFLVAGMFGNVLNLRHLAHLVGTDRPFYGLQARGLFGDAAPHDDLVTAATDYIAEIKQVQPEGPYLLGGFSGGGITAYEIARQLEAQGDEVALVALLDTPLPVRRALSRADRMRIQWQELRAKGLAYPVIWARNRLAWEIAKRRSAPDTEAEGTGQQFHDAEIEAAFLRAVARYQMQGWDGTLALFRPPLRGKWDMGHGRLVDQDRAYVLADNDWGQWAPQLQVFEVPGDHDSMVLEPNVRVLATRLKKVIAMAEANTTRAPLREAAE